MKYKRIICFIDDDRVLAQHENGASILCVLNDWPSIMPFLTNPYSVMSHMPYSEFKPEWTVPAGVVEKAKYLLKSLPEVNFARNNDRQSTLAHKFIEENLFISDIPPQIQ